MGSFFWGLKTGRIPQELRWVTVHDRHRFLHWVIANVPVGIWQVGGAYHPEVLDALLPYKLSQPGDKDKDGDLDVAVTEESRLCILELLPKWNLDGNLVSFAYYAQGRVWVEGRDNMMHTCIDSEFAAYGGFADMVFTGVVAPPNGTTSPSKARPFLWDLP